MELLAVHKGLMFQVWYFLQLLLFPLLLLLWEPWFETHATGNEAEHATTPLLQFVLCLFLLYFPFLLLEVLGGPAILGEVMLHAALPRLGVALAEYQVEGGKKAYKPADTRNTLVHVHGCRGDDLPVLSLSGHFHGYDCYILVVKFTILIREDVAVHGVSALDEGVSIEVELLVETLGRVPNLCRVVEHQRGHAIPEVRPNRHEVRILNTSHDVVVGEVPGGDIGFDGDVVPLVEAAIVWGYLLIASDCHLHHEVFSQRERAYSTVGLVWGNH
jgi:hypothetical protein